MATSSRSHAPGPHVEAEALVWEPAGAAASFRYARAELFAPL